MKYYFSVFERKLADTLNRFFCLLNLLQLATNRVNLRRAPVMHLILILSQQFHYFSNHISVCKNDLFVDTNKGCSPPGWFMEMTDQKNFIGFDMHM